LISRQMQKQQPGQIDSQKLLVVKADKLS